MRNAVVEEAQAGIKISRRNIYNLRYTHDTTLIVKVKEESENVGLELNFQKTEIMASSPITSWHTDGETMKTVRDFIFFGSKITTDGD